MSATNPPPATQTQPSQIHPTISQWNPQIVAEMDAAQRQHIVKTADHRDNGIPLGEYTRVICASLAPIPSKFVPNVRSRAATNGLQAACITIIPVLADIFLNKNLSGDELYRQLTVAAKTIAESFVLAAGVTCLEDVLRVKLEQQLRNPQFIDYVSKLSGVSDLIFKVSLFSCAEISSASRFQGDVDIGMAPFGRTSLSSIIQGWRDMLGFPCHGRY